jgi:Icc-related predicted phosphoesterase
MPAGKGTLLADQRIMTPKTVRLAAVGDLHYVRGGQPALSWLSRVADAADVLVLCGDLTDYGRAEEAHELARELSTAVRIPIVAVLGNHDFESDQVAEVSAALRDVGVNLLDGETCELLGVGFAGIKGFAGGFGRGALGPWGEPVIKQFVQEAISEALKLEAALARLRTPHKVAVLHYSPVPDTVDGEPREIYPYLGSSRLAEPLARYPVTAVFHGHAHNGVAQGMAGPTPVYNVSLPLMARSSPDLPVKILTLESV